MVRVWILSILILTFLLGFVSEGFTQTSVRQPHGVRRAQEYFKVRGAKRSIASTKKKKYLKAQKMKKRRRY